MTEPYLVSICIPTYNQTDLLKRNLDALCLQTYKQFEVIVSDDSTNNNVALLIAQYKGRLPIHYSKNEIPLGSPANWNKTLDLAKGGLIKFMHHDDWFKHENSLREFVSVFEKHPESEMAFCVTEILNLASLSISFNRPDNDFLDGLKKDPTILFNNNRIGAPSAVIYKTNSLRFDENIRYVVDSDFYIQLLQHNNNFVYIDHPLIVNTSAHAGQVTAASMNKETQIGEHLYLYNKLYGPKIPGKSLSLFFIALFRQYGFKSMDELKEFNRSLPQPLWYFKFLLFLSKLLERRKTVFSKS